MGGNNITVLRAVIAFLLIETAYVSRGWANDKGYITAVPKKTHIFIMTGRPDLTRPINQEEKESLCYIDARPVQISPTKAALFCAMQVVGRPVIDFDGGSDAIIFDDIVGISPENAVPLMRNQYQLHPNTGKSVVMVKYPIRGGFVPLGAKMADGSPHPHTGTGFGLSVVYSFPADRYELLAAHAKDRIQYLQLQQYRYDGSSFQIVESRPVQYDQLIPGWVINNMGLTNAIPDGSDLLFSLSGMRPDQQQGSGLSRWRYIDGAWRPVSFILVSGPDGSFEPSVIHDTNGALLFCVRSGEKFLLWHSTDSGQTWQQIINLEKMRAETPVTLNRTVGGTPFIIGNPYCGSYKNGLGREVKSSRWRKNTAIWPLTKDRRGVREPTFTFNWNNARYGDSPNGSALWADHATGGIVRLADGKLHCIVCMRVWVRDEVTERVINTPQSGCWIREIMTVNDGPEVPVWKF